uniref:Uncharacterized protein n=1 Tax=Kalanchoe fedtschenkoi TaxID=63787 RepID=A0A7N0VI86_KALFE
MSLTASPSSACRFSSSAFLGLTSNRDLQLLTRRKRPQTPKFPQACLSSSSGIQLFFSFPNAFSFWVPKFLSTSAFMFLSALSHIIDHQFVRALYSLVAHCNL